MLKAKTLFQRITMLAGNAAVARYVHSLAEAEGLGKVPLEDDEVVELKTEKVLVTITKDTMYAMNVYGTVYEDFTRRDCKLKILEPRERVIYDKKNSEHK